MGQKAQSVTTTVRNLHLSISAINNDLEWPWRSLQLFETILTECLRKYTAYIHYEVAVK